MRYLLITYVTKPDGKIDEIINLSKSLRAKDYTLCNIIMDFRRQSIEKCVIEGNRLDTSWQQLLTYLLSNYKNIVTELAKENGYQIIVDADEGTSVDKIEN